MTRFLAKHSPLVILAGLCIVLSFLSEDFREPRNLREVMLRTSALGVIALGQLLVILTGGIDLSVGSVAAFAGVCAGLTMKALEPSLGPLAMPVGMLAGLAAGLLCGGINGILAAKGRIQPFIVTLGMMMVARGAALLLTGSQTVFGLPQSIKFLGGTARVGEGVTWWIPVIIFLVAAAIFVVMLSYTRFGRALYSTGGNREGARLSGINTDWVRTGAFAVSGLMAGLGGVLIMAKVSVADPKAAEMLELDAIAACVIGGTSLMGGEGNPLGAVAGALIMNVLVNFCNLMNISPNWQRILVGGLIIALVFYDNFRKRRAGLLKE